MQIAQPFPLLKAQCVYVLLNTYRLGVAVGHLHIIKPEKVCELYRHREITS